MALEKLIIVLTVFAIVLGGHQHEVEAKNGTKKTLAAENGQQSRSANPGREKGAMQQLTSLMNRTADRRHNRRKGKENFNELLKLTQNQNQNQNDNDMMNDNEGSINLNEKTATGTKSFSLTEKIKALRHEGPNYEAANKNNNVPQVAGVFCNFENGTNGSLIDTCMWQWNATVSRHGLGFQVAAAADVAIMNETSRGLQFSGPSTDADGNVEGHFLYLPVDPTMENMVIKSPTYRGLWEFCKFEAEFHQSKMQNASIRLVSESTVTEVQWILQEVAGNNFELWHPMRLLIGKVVQEVSIMIEITRPLRVSLDSPLPHIAIDNIRMVDCLPEPPVFAGQCPPGQLKCNIMNNESCIKLQQICDLVKDCDDGSDENQNCDKMPYGSYCNFEQDNCGFVNIPQPVLKWSRHNGPTPTDKTGPNYDHTCGPQDLHSTKVAPLTPTQNRSLAQCVGYYFFVNMNVTGPNKEKADFASTALMTTAVFNPPPKVHVNISSSYYNCCVIRFYYQQNGRNYGSLSVNLVELTARGNLTTSLWYSSKDKGENWYRAEIFLPNVTRRYYLEFWTRMGMRIYSDSAIDDFSMAPECFGLNIDPKELGDYNYYDPVFVNNTKTHPAFEGKPMYRFTSCGATGRFGPTQAMCDAEYNNTDIAVAVENGIQVWQVPEEGLYTIIALGASGGLGAAWAGVAHGATARALFQLQRGERLHLLPGQPGLNACKKTLSAQENPECSRAANESLVFTSKTQEVRYTQVQDGGGGGGGATFVFLVDNDGQELPLLVAGGGGGISVGAFRDDGSQHARLATNATPESGYMYGEIGKTSGAGGGWTARAGPSTGGFELVRGAALRAGAGGGRACAARAHGGFGGGGGGCQRGGGGGGWIGGDTNEGAGLHGRGGWSYVEAARALPGFSAVAVAPHSGPGEVVIIPAIHECGCAYRCVALDEARSAVRCFCPGPDADCMLKDVWARVSWPMLWATAVLVASFAVVVLCTCLYLYNNYQRKKEEELRQKHLLEQEVQLHRLRHAPNRNENQLSMGFNPNYGSETFMPQGVDLSGLPQVPRECLTLVKALGNGAFGEVYQGLYRSRDGAETPVAVKTLPEHASSQAETDFLMEAAIMANFNHPNVVHIIGICFEGFSRNLPRFIVLELLAGGDLKHFLRQSRPSPGRASALTIKDLLLCSLDVCKGCRYLEAKRFIHRDIAARNCLLTSRGPGRVVKIADFGMARDVYRAEYYKKGGKAMLPIKWMPPEAYIDGVFTIKTDVWSFGVLLWEVFSLGMMPYSSCANREVMDMVSGGKRLERPICCPADVYKLMCECWDSFPEKRPTFSYMFYRIQRVLQDPDITSAPIPVMHPLLVPSAAVEVNSIQPQPARPAASRAQCGPCDYLEPLPPLEPPASSMDQTGSRSSSSGGSPDCLTGADLHYPPLLPASKGYGNIPMGTRRGSCSARREAASAAETATTTKFRLSSSTDSLLSSGFLELQDSGEGPPVVWETSFSQPRAAPPTVGITSPPSKSPEDALSSEIEANDNAVDKTNNHLVPERKIAPIASPDPPLIYERAGKEPPKLKPKPIFPKPNTNISGHQADKPISITSTSPNPPEDALSSRIEANANVLDKSNNHLAPECKTAPIASPDPPLIYERTSKEPPKLKPKPLCLDAAQLEQNLNALKKNSGSVNLNTMNILPSYINVVTPKKLSQSKTIQIDPKKAVIHDLQTPKEEPKEEKANTKQLNSAASLLSGPMTDLPYADSDNASSNSGSANVVVGEKKVLKQGSNGVAESEISC